MRDFRSAVVYQIYPKSFLDTGGDGLGDLRGVIEKLDYLQALGADYLWLTPFFRSPQRDGGYDVSDYLSVDPVYGTLADVDELIAGAAERDMGVMLDMVFNHTSTQHEWFQRALAGEQEYQDFYIFRPGTPDRPPTNWQSKFGGSAWEWVPSLGKWYLHLFDVTQADLNWNNPRVRAELQQVVRFWMQRGVHGFRFDVVNLISKPGEFVDDDAGDGRRFYTDGPRVHEFLQELARETGLGAVLTVGEMSSTSVEQCLLYSQPERGELNMVFNFHHLKVDYAGGDKWALSPPDFMELKRILFGWQAAMQAGGGWLAAFWGNHDQPRPVSRFGDDGVYWAESAKMLATAQMFLRATPYVFQGEEIGMPNAPFTSVAQYRDVESLNHYRILRDRGLADADALRVLAARSRDHARTPLRWTPDGGFTDAAPWIEPVPGRAGLDVQTQLADPDSVLNYYASLIRTRQQQPIYAHGEFVPLLEDHPQVLTYARRWQDEESLIFCNFSDQEVTVDWELAAEHRLVIGNYAAAPQQGPAQTVLLRPYEALVYHRAGAEADAEAAAESARHI